MSKELEALNTIIYSYGYDENVEIVSKALKALEIIKEKEVDVQLLEDSKNLNDYNWCVHTKNRALTQEEFDLLKEVLLRD